MEQEANKSPVIAVIITFVIAFWFGFFVGWLITGRTVDQGLTAFQEKKNQSLSEEESGQALQKSFSASGGTSALRAEDQLASKSARVALIALDREGWVAIHEDNEGKPGAILGAAWLPAGSHKQIEVDLLRGMEAGRRYYAMLHGEVKEESENEESHIFDLEKDLPMQDAQGNVITVLFETISSPN